MKITLVATQRRFKRRDIDVIDDQRQRLEVLAKETGGWLTPTYAIVDRAKKVKLAGDTKEAIRLLTMAIQAEEADRRLIKKEQRHNYWSQWLVSKFPWVSLK